jgi:hypothetical protein
VIDIIVDGEWKLGVGPIDRGGRREQEMMTAMMAATFEDIDEPLKVGFDIMMRMRQRMANAGLCREMNDGWKAVRGEKFDDVIAIREIEFDELETRKASKLLKPCFLERRVVICVQVVETNNGAAALR